MAFYDDDGNRYELVNGEYVRTGKKKPQSMTMPAGLLESALQGATFGTSDEMQAGLGAAYDVAKGALTGQPAQFSERYGTRQQELEQAYNQWARQHPALALGGGMAGAVGTGGGLVSAGKAALPRVAQALAGAPKALTYPAAGAVGGAAAGAGSASPGERLEGAALGGALGAGAGAVAPMVGRVAEHMLRPLRPAGGRAMQQIVKALRNDQLTPDEAALRLRALGPKATLADVGENMRTNLETAAQVPGMARQRALSLYSRRSEGQAGRILDPLRRSIGPDDGVYETLEELATIRQQLASPLYEMAYEQGVDMTPALKRLLEKSPTVQRAWTAAKRRGLDMDALSPEGLSDLGDVTPSLRGWQAIKEVLDDAVGTLKRQGKGKRAGELTNVKKRILEELDTQNDLYKNARQVWAGAAEAQESLEQGMKFLNTPASTTINELKRMSPMQRDAFKIGFKQSLQDRIEKMGDTHDVSRLFRNESMRRKLRALLPTEDYVDLMNTVKAEAEKQRTYGSLFNSRTMGRQEAAREMQAGDLGSAMGDIATGRPVQGALGAIRSGVQQVMPGGGLSPGLAQAVASPLMQTDPAQQALILQALRRSYGLPGLGPTLGLAGGMEAGLMSSP